MNGSFVLKGKDGAAGGYAMARGGVLRFRLPEDIGGVRLTALYEDGEQAFNGDFGGGEVEQPIGKHALVGAYVSSGGRLLFDTGREARAAFERAARRSALGQTEAAKPRQSKSIKSASIKEEESRVGPRETAERRWPPPPCMTGAKYVNGRFVLTEEAAH